MSWEVANLKLQIKQKLQIKMVKKIHKYNRMQMWTSRLLITWLKIY